MRVLGLKVLILVLCLTNVQMAAAFIAFDQVNLDSAQRHDLQCSRLPHRGLQIFAFSSPQSAEVTDKMGVTTIQEFQYIICSSPESHIANCTTENLISTIRRTQLRDAYQRCFENFLASQESNTVEEFDYDYEGMTTAP